jgi:small-conductance mechanosensitive channel
VQELRGRYVVVRDRDGVETLVPNQHLITNPVINWSYTDPRVRLKLPVRGQLQGRSGSGAGVLLSAAHGHPRILREPGPVSRLMSFNEYGIELELRFWISDPQEGVNNVRSDVNRSDLASCSASAASRSRWRSTTMRVMVQLRDGGPPEAAAPAHRRCRSRSVT